MEPVLGLPLLTVPERVREDVVRDSLVELGVFPMAERSNVSQARCGEALERRRIPRSRSDYVLASPLIRRTKDGCWEDEEVGTWGGKSMEMEVFQ